MEWYDWAIPLATLVVGIIINFAKARKGCKLFCEFWGLDFKEEWKKQKKL